MPVGKSFRMRLIRSTRTLKTERRPAPVQRVAVKPTSVEIVRAFKRSPGAGEILARIPKAATVATSASARSAARSSS